MLGILTTPAEAGIYFAAARVAALTTFAQTAVKAIASPLVSKVFAEGDPRRLQRLATGIVQLSFWPSLLAALVMIVFGEPILALFGPEFVAARLPLTLLVCGYLMNAAAGAVGILLNMTGHQNATARVFTIAALLNIVLNLLFIPRFGTVGAALSTALTMAIWNVWLSALVQRRLGLHTSVLGPLIRLFDRRS
jgi:O-antigen/teichoic acid export membrane protein